MPLDTEDAAIEQQGTEFNATQSHDLKFHGCYVELEDYLSGLGSSEVRTPARLFKWTQVHTAD